MRLFDQTEFKVWNIKGLGHLFVKLKGFRVPLKRFFVLHLCGSTQFLKSKLEANWSRGLWAMIGKTDRQTHRLLLYIHTSLGTQICLQKSTFVTQSFKLSYRNISMVPQWKFKSNLCYHQTDKQTELISSHLWNDKYLFSRKLARQCEFWPNNILWKSGQEKYIVNLIEKSSKKVF